MWTHMSYRYINRRKFCLSVKLCHIEIVRIVRMMYSFKHFHKLYCLLLLIITYYYRNTGQWNAFRSWGSIERENNFLQYNSYFVVFSLIVIQWRRPFPSKGGLLHRRWHVRLVCIGVLAIWSHLTIAKCIVHHQHPPCVLVVKPKRLAPNPCNDLSREREKKKPFFSVFLLSTSPYVCFFRSLSGCFTYGVPIASSLYPFGFGLSFFRFTANRAPYLR